MQPQSGWVLDTTRSGCTRELCAFCGAQWQQAEVVNIRIFPYSMHKILEHGAWPRAQRTAGRCNDWGYGFIVFGLCCFGPL